ncbi:DUF5518 domain-containing protein [Halobacterium yunchengense]|uniref:DUF5518 domain-containing protein n=1 Tax=Halobacterium yunchengense TaxID=3108497 RepID=UPI0030096837
MVNWRAVLVGFAVQFVLGVFAFAIPGVGHAAAGLIGGFVAGWLADDGLWSGAVHGLLAGALGGLVVAFFVLLFGFVLTATGFVAGGVLGFGVAVFALVAFLLLAVDSAVAGAVGGWLAAR